METPTSPTSRDTHPNPHMQRQMQRKAHRSGATSRATDPPERLVYQLTCRHRQCERGHGLVIRKSSNLWGCTRERAMGRSGVVRVCRSSVYSYKEYVLYWYKSINTDT